MAGPLSSLKIIEMAGLGPCPLAGQLLADLGASVTVIDRRSGDDISKDVNRRGKKSIALDLKHPKGIALALKLIAKADALIEGFRPGVMERLGLGPDECLTQNPRLIYGRMTGWGQDGPLASTAGHDINYLAITGTLHAMGKDGEPPVPPLNLVADYGGGSMFLIMGVLSALIERGVSGRGQVVDAAMCEGIPAMMGLIQTMLAQGTWTRNREDNFIDGGAPYYRCYKTADEKFVAVGAIEPQFFAELISKLELKTELVQKQNSKADWPAMHALFEETFAAKTRDEWERVFEGSDACVAPVLDFDEAANHPHNKARHVFFERDGVIQADMAPRFGNFVPEINPPAQHTNADYLEILDHAGMSESEIKALEKSGIIT